MVLVGLISLGLAVIVVGGVSHAVEIPMISSLKPSEPIQFMISQGEEPSMGPVLPVGSIGCSTGLSWSQ